MVDRAAADAPRVVTAGHVLLDMFCDVIHQRGQLHVYPRLLGLAPPTTQA